MLLRDNSSRTENSGSKVARQDAESKAHEEATAQKQRRPKKERTERFQESNAQCSATTAECMDEGFQRHPAHKRAGQQKMRKREFSQLENEKRGKQVWKERAEPALSLLEHLENSRMA